MKGVDKSSRIEPKNLLERSSHISNTVISLDYPSLCLFPGNPPISPTYSGQLNGGTRSFDIQISIREKQTTRNNKVSPCKYICKN